MPQGYHFAFASASRHLLETRHFNPTRMPVKRRQFLLESATVNWTGYPYTSQILVLDFHVSIRH